MITAKRRLGAHGLLAGLALAAFSCSTAEPEHEHSGPSVEVGKTQQALFTNGDFESGQTGYVQPTGWTVTAYSNPGVTRTTPQTRAGLNLAAGGSNQTNIMYAAGGAESQADAVLGSGASLRWPKFGNYVAYMNSNPGSSNNTNSLKQTMTLGVNDVDPYDGKPHIRFAVAPVLENPGHSADAQPYYFVQVKNATTGSVLYVDYNASAEPGIPWKTSNSVYYTDWQLKDIAPTSTQATLGDQIELEVIAAGCSAGGHYGRVYVDGVGPSVPGLSVTGSAPAAANAGSNITYTLAFKNGGNATAGNVTVEFNTPPSTTFQALNASGAVCSQPAVGATGLVSCVYGLVDPGEADSLQVTVKLNANASGTITAGNYQISANNASKLLGSKLYTTVTSNVSYADVGVTISNGVGAVNWNQAVTYTIVATNQGPSAVTGGTLADTIPAELTGATWTCSGTGGASCAASGSGSISDSTVDLPVGASVTYVVQATLAASGSATRVVNTASFTMPAGISDPQPSDNAAADTDNITTTYTLTVNKAGSATGTVVSVPGAISCDGQCSSQAATFASGAALILAALPDTDKVFTGWSGGGCSGTSNCAITLSGNTTVTATFDNPPSCTMDSNCSSSRYCDGVSQTCLKRLPNGSSIPSDGIHGGTCATAGSVCVSGLCNANNNKCAQACSADSSCPSDSFCDNSVMYCTSKLPAGTSIPSDGIHTGVCANAAAVCQSGSCNTTSITCGNGSGVSCTSNSQCTNNVCKSGACLPSASSCYADADCSGSQYCNRSTYTCVNKLANGTAIPNDTLHTAMCSDAAAVCQSGQCNTTTTTCAAASGATCSAANQCATNTCTSGRCLPASNGCYTDAACGAGKYCDWTTYTCTTKLNAGTSIPSDGLHTNSCTDAAAVCLSGQCNSAQKTCGQANGSACTTGNECTNDTCTSGYCVPSSGGCYLDADCSGSQYCNRNSLTCTTKLSSGTSIPSDGLHGGSCSDAPAVCQSGLCNTGSSTCASSNNSTCSTANECVSATCKSGHCVPASGGCYVDSECGAGEYCDRSSLSCTAKLGNGTSIPSDGLHTNSCADAAAVCLSGQCNSAQKTCGQANGSACTTGNECTNNTCTSGYCVPSSGGCYLDSDCSGSQYCDRSNLTCTSKLSPGTGIPATDGYHLADCSAAPAVCQSGLCNSISTTCASSDNSTCSNDNQCVSATCKSGHCVPDTNGCYLDVDCGAGKYCVRDMLTCTVQLDKGAAIPPTDGYHAGTCADAAAVCASGQCNSATTTCGSPVVTACTSASECTSNVCSNNKCGVSDGGAGCTAGNAATTCQSGTCASSHCVPAGGSGCYQDSDCDASEFCDRATLLCQTKLSNGTAIPSDGLHDGKCSQANAQAVCQSSGCNAVTNTCGTTNGNACSDPNECIRNICGGNGKCGHENGVGPCTQINGKFVCQSATCSATANVCVAPSTQTCASDSDCAASTYCDALNAVCVPDLPNGRPIPGDVLHGGVCTANVGMAVCLSGACNQSSQTCAAAIGANCTGAADCAGNLCGSNGKCGGAPGQGPCTVQDQATTCQSGACGQDGKCLAAGGCNVDADCQPSGYCSGTSNTCSARLPAGSPLPSDGDHASCPGSGLSAACETGLCSPDTDRCVKPNGDDCSDANQCASGTCGTNGKCGIEDGGTCTPGENADCQSGSCGSGGTCDAVVACTADADCSGAGGFCQDGSCTPKLSVGAAIPGDALHMGTCSPTNASAVCGSGRCNPDTDTCAAASGGSCAIGAQCVSNVCAVNGQCGLPNGQGPCTSGSASTVCQSGVCSSGNVCIPYAGCARDADCVASEFCDGTQYTCKPKLSAGTSIPSDGLHDGNCTTQNAAVCASGTCNPVTDSCAAPNGDSCAGPSDCASNVCSDDGKCGYPNGEGPCVPAHPEVCRSATCSATSLICIPGGGCGSDNDCQSGSYCSTSDHQCTARVPSGNPVPASLNAGQCPDSGITRACASGLCDTTSDTCVSANGINCSDGSECQSGVCGGNGQCGTEDGGACTADHAALCQSGLCGDQGTCSPAAPCTADADCSPAGYCDGSYCRALRKPGESLPDDSLHDGKCSEALAQAACSSGSCNETSDTCSAPFGAPCASADACDANVCGSDGQCGLPVGEGTCNNLNAAVRCRTQLCSAAGVCLPELESGCAVDADCTEGHYCKRDSYECVAKLADGVAIPDDGLHDGTCTQQSAAQVCVSGACNPVTDTCARPNGADCSAANTCVTNVCGSNGKCGTAEGDGMCTTETASTCQTGRCSASTGKCINEELGCAADADCDDTRYCAIGSRSCVSKLAAGIKLPMDALHSGTCSAALATAVCQSAACNPQTNTCAADNGTGCESAGQCVSNVCGGNAKCGRAVGESGCKTASQTLDCQSGFCAASGSCVPPSGCQQDADCPSSAFCNRTAHACAPKLDAGTPLPSDGLHDGQCSAALAQAVCADGQCNPTTNTCALSAASSCTQPEQCTTGVCSDNGKCGLGDGTGPCSKDGECQSGKCQPDVNKCVAAASGCTEDSDCPATQYCDRSHVTCAADLPDGAAIPGDSASGGKCTAEVAKVVCASGACNPDNDTCARLGSASCDQDAQCASGSCSDGKCGSPDASGACSESNAATACQSGECQLDLGRCVAVTSGCRADSDCPSGQYCDANKLSCATKVSSGGKLPADAMHSSECNAEVASAVCSTGACNEKTDRCALALGEACVSASECGSNACLDSTCVPTSKAPAANSLGGGGCSVANVGEGAERTRALLLLAAALGLCMRLGRARRKR